jgi:Type II CAAX prenyl endopeptidase Rce1-like
MGSLASAGAITKASAGTTIPETSAAITETASAESRAAAKPSQKRLLAETGVGFALILLVIWTPRPWQGFLWWLALGGIALIVADRFEGFAAMGLRLQNLGRSLWIAGAALLIAAIAVVIAARMHTLHMQEDGPFGFLAAYCAYAVWSGVQQFLLQGFFLPSILRLTKSPTLAVLLAAGLFSLAHVPSVLLVPLTFVWGLAACFLFLHYRNLYPLALAHAILGITVAITIPGHVDHNMRVGLGYLNYGHHRHGDRPYPLAQPLPKP